MDKIIGAGTNTVALDEATRTVEDYFRSLSRDPDAIDDFFKFEVDYALFRPQTGSYAIACTHSSIRIHEQKHEVAVHAGNGRIIAVRKIA